MMEGGLTTEDKLRDTESGDLQMSAFWGPRSLFQQWRSTLWRVRRSGIEGIEGVKRMKAWVTGKYFAVIGRPFAVCIIPRVNQTTSLIVRGKKVLAPGCGQSCDSRYGYNPIKSIRE
jgi:hypothetical protein